MHHSARVCLHITKCIYFPLTPTRFTGLDRITRWLSDKKQKLLILHEHLGTTPVVGMLCVFVMCLVPNATCVSGLSFIDLSIQFSLTFIHSFPKHLPNIKKLMVLFLIVTHHIF